MYERTFTRIAVAHHFLPQRVEPFNHRPLPHFNRSARAACPRSDAISAAVPNFVLAIGAAGQEELGNRLVAFVRGHAKRRDHVVLVSIWFGSVPTPGASSRATAASWPFSAAMGRPNEGPTTSIVIAMLQCVPSMPMLSTQLERGSARENSTKPREKRYTREQRT